MLKELYSKENIRVQGELGEFLRPTKIFAGTLNEHYFYPDDIVEPQHRPNEWKTPKNILVLSGSGQVKGRASSYHFAKLFAEGLSRAEPQPKVELIHLRDYQFSECRGCFGCWRNGGQCLQKDDFEMVIKPRLDVCDLLVFAYPLYFYDFPPQIRDVMTRLFVYDHPRFYWNNKIDDVTHYLRKSYKFSLFLLSTGGVFDRAQVEVPVTQAKLLSRRHDVPYLGCIHRQTGLGFIVPAARTALHDKIDAALERAGFELASNGRVSQKIIQLVEKDVMTPAQLRAGARAYQHWLTKKFKFPLETPVVTPSQFDIKATD